MQGDTTDWRFCVRVLPRGKRRGGRPYGRRGDLRELRDPGHTQQRVERAWGGFTQRKRGELAGPRTRVLWTIRWVPTERHHG